MPSVKFKHLSYGYIGLKCKHATLNAQFYSEFLTGIFAGQIQLFLLLPLPQRIPRSDFFKELSIVETPYFNRKLLKVINLLTQNQMKSYDEFLKCKTEENARKFINLSNVLMRYGKFDRTHFKNFGQEIPYALEIEILFETIRLEAILSANDHISINNFLEIYKKYIHIKNASQREVIILLNRIIVYFSRFDNDKNKKDMILEIGEYLLNILSIYEDKDFIANLHKSVAYRGLSMIAAFGYNTQHLLMNKSEEIARKLLLSNNNLEKIVAFENLYTFLQSKYKWSFLNNKLNDAEENLIEMIQIDPFDSTAYNELGFHYAKQNKFEKAAVQFKKAYDMGCPGIAMNAYYYAKCLENIGRENESINFLLKSAQIDDQSVSPWLDLFDYYKKTKNITKMQKISRHLLNKPHLKEQLESEEIFNLQNII